MGFSIRLAGVDDKPRILEAIAEYLPDLDAEKRWHWLYQSNPHGRALTWLVLDGETLAGLTSFFPRRMISDGREIKAALGGDGYVRPAFRRRGLGELMHKASRAAMREHGIEVMFGTPMPANLTPLTKAGAKTIGDTVRYVRPLSARLLKLPEKLSPLLRPRRGGAGLSPMMENDRRVDEVWEEARGELRLATVRDAAFYSWRFLRSPSQRQKAFVVVEGGRAIGACALERLDDRLRVVDIVAPQQKWARVFGAAVGFAPDCASLEIKLTRDDAQARRLWLHGFVGREPKPLNLLLPEGEPNSVVYYDCARWTFTWAESDMDHG